MPERPILIFPTPQAADRSSAGTADRSSPTMMTSVFTGSIMVRSSAWKSPATMRTRGLPRRPRAAPRALENSSPLQAYRHRRPPPPARTWQAAQPSVRRNQPPPPRRLPMISSPPNRSKPSLVTLGQLPATSIFCRPRPCRRLRCPPLPCPPRPCPLYRPVPQRQPVCPLVFPRCRLRCCHRR